MNIVRMRQSYREGLRGRLEALRGLDLQQKSDRESLRRIAHALYGSSGSYGFSAVAEAAHAIENCSDLLLSARYHALIDRVLVELKYAEEGTPIRLLVIEDDPVMVALLQELLTEPGRLLHFAGNLADGLTLISMHAFDLILLDVSLPDGDGRRLLLHLRENPETVDLPVLALSGSEKPGLEAECLALGADAFVAKPPDPLLLRARIAATLQRRLGRADSVSHSEASHKSPDWSAAESIAQPKKILLIDDDPEMIIMLAGMLSRQGYNLTRAHDGLEAQRILEAHAFDAVILDLNLPGMDGMELLRRLQSRIREGLHVVVLSARQSEQDRLQAFELRAEDYVTKPFYPSELAARVRRLIPI